MKLRGECLHTYMSREQWWRCVGQTDVETSECFEQMKDNTLKDAQGGSN